MRAARPNQRYIPKNEDRNSTGRRRSIFLRCGKIHRTDWIVADKLDAFVYGTGYLEATLIKLTGWSWRPHAQREEGWRRNVGGVGDAAGGKCPSREKVYTVARCSDATDEFSGQYRGRKVRYRGWDGRSGIGSGCERGEKKRRRFTQTVVASSRVLRIYGGHTLARTGRITHSLVTHIQLIFR